MTSAGHPGPLSRGAEDEPAAAPPRRRSTDESSGPWLDARDRVTRALRAPFRPPLAGGVMAAAVLAVVLQTGGLVARLTCPAGSCSGGAAALARRWDMDELGSVPRAYTTVLFLAVALAAAVGVVRCARAGARPWWSVLALSGLALCLAKAWSVHALVEVSLGGVLSEAGIQLVFVAVAAVGLTVVLLSGSRVRQDTRTATLTWLVLYAVAGIGLAAVTNVVWSLGPGAQAAAVFVEETAEALTAVGLLAVVLAGVRDLSARRG